MRNVLYGALIAGFLLFSSGCTTIAGGVARVFGMTEPEAPQSAEPAERTPIRFPESDEVPPGEFARAESEILRLVNEERLAHGLAPVIGHRGLDLLSRAHSEDMGTRGYYDHVDPDGVTPNQRITDALCDRYYLLSSAENIAYRERSGGSLSPADEQLAREFMQGWMNSPGHRANILHPDSTHMGVGFSRSGNRVYATQKFMRYLVRLENNRNGDSIPMEDAVLLFVPNPGLNGTDLVIRVGLPDPQARWETGSGSFYRGFGFLEPAWEDETRFTVALPVDRFGPGPYTLQFGDRGGTSTYAAVFRFSVE